MDNKEGCPVQACIGKMLCMAVPLFIYFIVAGYLIHHVWLMPIYEQTASLWRPMDEMKEMFPLLLAYYAVLSLVISMLFCKVKKAKMQGCGTAGEPVPEGDCKIGGKHCPIKGGICFGVVIGLLMGTMCAGSYIFMPIPGELAVKWFFADLIQGIGAGVVLALICHCKSKGCKTQ